MRGRESTRITAREKDFLVERLYENAVTDRYTTADLKLPRKDAKKKPWVQAVIDAANTPFAPDPAIEEARLAGIRRQAQLKSEIANCERIMAAVNCQVKEGLEWRINRLVDELLSIT